MSNPEELFQDKNLAFDLETIADKSIILSLPAIKPAGNLKNPDKIKADINKKKKDQLAKLGLNPITARICCFGWYDGKEKNTIFLKDESSRAEKKLLQQSWEILAEADRFVTFGGIPFDVPMLRMRSLINKVRPSIDISTRKYSFNTNHFDCQAILNNWEKFKSGTLDFYAKLLLGFSPKEEFSGDQVQDMWNMQLYDEIAKYCMGDAVATYEIFKLMQDYYL